MIESKLAKVGGPNPVFPIQASCKDSYKLVGFLLMLEDCWPIETDKDWWQVHLATMCWN